MEFDTLITPIGNYEFDDQVDRFVISTGGRGLPPINHVTEEWPFRHGAVHLGYKVKPKVIRLIHHRIAGEQRSDFWNARADILNHIRYNLGKLTLRKALDTGVSYDLDVYINGGATLDEDGPLGRGKWHVRDVFEFISFYPFWYSSVESSLTIDLTAGASTFIFPIDFDIEFGGGTNFANAGIVYQGTWETYPRIVINGPLINPVIENTTTGKRLSLVYSLITGESITIDLNPDKKTVVNNQGQNVIGLLSPDSNLATFKIEPDPIAPGGGNNFSVYGGSGDVNTSIEIYYHERFIGI